MASRARPTYDELVAAERAVRALLAAGAEAELRAIPGVVHVSVGLKERANVVTDERCIRVYVREKRPLDTVPPAERIPTAVGGVPTDVNIVRPGRFTTDFGRYRPVKGGILISNRILFANDKGTEVVIQAGTFGCVATRTSDRAPVLLTNWHVLSAGGGEKGNRVYQPPPQFFDQVPLADAPVRPHDKHDAIAKIAKFAISEKVDGAIARLDVSSCCRCCGIDFRNEIAGLSENGSPPSDKILGMRQATWDQTVYMVGAASGRQQGRVVDPTGPDLTIKTHTFKQQIYITSDDLFAFSTEGDSGAAIIDEDGFIVGLLFAANDLPGQDGRSVANHIADVCAELGITINLTPGTTPTAGAQLLPRPETWGGIEAYDAARARLLGDAAGAWLWELGETHYEEIVQLVTTHRAVKLAWHRAGGPALFAQGMETLRDGGETLPVPADGTTLESALARIGAALHAHGSAALRDAIDAHREGLLAAVRDSATLDEVLGKIAMGRARDAGVT
ncbi:hypothetical protein J421_5195 (plasmid) [Gemmatirosa kalamazoonensis]|uniref:Uncharacterized protein n=1 Tax=Gemmatirosa kalamazoonensis TaxID=861299 RepID=W0RR04_9BACT|nr:hypothetical protein [Gemmatirosa kalamazoonensis]AHG92730.1 hypothetical protein J421_5195 [Gemmatirosa kalamazoonensis]